MKNFLFLLVAALFLFACDNNQKLTYGKTGLPKNCRAIIKSNIDGYNKGLYTAEEALDSIDRNCGEFGYSW